MCGGRRYLGYMRPKPVRSIPDDLERHAGSRDYDHQQNFSFNPAIIPLSSNTGIAVVSDGDQIIAKCNQHLQPDGPTKSYSFTHTFHASFRP